MRLVSLIIPTYGRKKELIRLLESIKNQNYKNIEVIVIDQNHPEFLEQEILYYKKIINLKYKIIYEKGAANARNIGYIMSKGEIICFPDDDSEIMPDTIEIALDFIKRKKVECVFGKTIDRKGNDSVIKYFKKESDLKLSDYEGKFIEATMFIDTKIFEQYKYDNTFGVGTFYGAEEAHDLVLRLLKDDVKISYSPMIKFYHPNKILDYNNKDEIKRVFSYRCGFSHLCIKHKLYKKLYKRIMLIICYLPYLIVFKRNKIRYYLAELLGLLTGITVR